MAKRNVIFLSTTEDHVWITLPFRIRGVGLTYRQARRQAIHYRQQGFLARVRPRAGKFLIATYAPRAHAPRPCDLKI